MGNAISPRGDSPSIASRFSNNGRTMASFASISTDKLARLVGTPACPTLIDVREAEALAADPRLVPTSSWRDYTAAHQWAADFRGKQVVVSCQKGKKLAEGAAAFLRNAGAS